jgi:aspartyl-tRNA(Asn)/glutamyl-tRNA(Gln) amidotransferase subunit C
MTKINAADVRKLARLCRLKLTGQEVEKYQNELSAILSYVDVLQNVDVEGLEPTSQVTGLQNVVRPDELIVYGATPEDLLKNAPATENNQFKVKRIIQ